MPIYEYECPTHGRFEVQQRITESALSECTVESCGKPVRKLISSTSFALKGGGWFADGYSSTPKPAGSESASAAAPATSGPATAAPAGPSTGNT